VFFRAPCRFISAIHIPRDHAAAHETLISGGGDPVLKVWQWRTGRRLYDVPIEEAVLPFIAVRRARPKRGYDGDGERKPPTRRWLARQRRRQAKAATVTATPSGENAATIPRAEEAAEVGAGAEVEVEDEGEGEDEGDESGDDAVDMGAASAAASGEPEEMPAPVLVMQKIETSKIDGRLVLVFSAVGCVSHLYWLCLVLLRTI
jgi:tRNA (guanine-N(7)-)-methyltransferase subunit TRM82